MLFLSSLLSSRGQSTEGRRAQGLPIAENSFPVNEEVVGSTGPHGLIPRGQPTRGPDPTRVPLHDCIRASCPGPCLHLNFQLAPLRSSGVTLPQAAPLPSLKDKKWVGTHGLPRKRPVLKQLRPGVLQAEGPMGTGAMDSQSSHFLPPAVKGPPPHPRQASGPPGTWVEQWLWPRRALPIFISESLPHTLGGPAR